MPMVRVDKLTPGMQLAEDVLNANGMLLLGKGTALTEKTIQLLHRWEVEVLRVLGPSGGDDAAEAVADAPPEVMAALEENLRKRFKNVPNDPTIVEVVKRLALERQVRQWAKKHPDGKP